MRCLLAICCLLLWANPSWSQDESVAPDTQEAIDWADPDEVVEQFSGIADGGKEQQFESHSYDAGQYPESMRSLMQWSPQAGSETDDSATLLRGILSSPDFQIDEVPEVQESPILKQLADWFNRTMRNIGNLFGLGNNSNTLLVYVLVILALALVAMIIRQLILNGGSPRGRSSFGSKQELSAEADLAALAEQHAARGDYRMAMRYRFLAVLRSLDLPASTLTTNSVLVRKVRSGHPALHDEFSQLVRIFEDAWYGSLDVDGNQYREAAALAGSLDRRIRIREEESV